MCPEFPSHQLWENETLIGEELQSSINDMYFNCLRYEKIEGMIRPDLAYSSK